MPLTGLAKAKLVLCSAIRTTFLLQDNVLGKIHCQVCQVHENYNFVHFGLCAL